MAAKRSPGRKPGIGIIVESKAREAGDRIVSRSVDSEIYVALFRICRKKPRSGEMFIARNSFLFLSSLRGLAILILFHKTKMEERLWAINISCLTALFRKTPKRTIESHAANVAW
jgi:hypothetical protein